MNTMFWQVILPLSATGSCAVLAMILLQRLLRRSAGAAAYPVLLAGSLLFYLIPVGWWFPAGAGAVTGAA
ncbi:MAG: hypothetical protein IJ484_09505 [Oscillospiraceae bacterium]|nr:hypothetical protein [Oscillospiraceae bacterium]